MKPPAVRHRSGIPNYRRCVIWHWSPCSRSANSLFLKACRIKFVGSYLCSKRDSVPRLGNVCEQSRILPLPGLILVPVCCRMINANVVLRGRAKTNCLCWIIYSTSEKYLFLADARSQDFDSFKNKRNLSKWVFLAIHSACRTPSEF